MPKPILIAFAPVALAPLPIAIAFAFVAEPATDSPPNAIELAPAAFAPAVAFPPKAKAPSAVACVAVAVVLPPAPIAVE